MPLLRNTVLNVSKYWANRFQKFIYGWMDFWGQSPYGTRHRYLRHHRQGIEEIRKRWGDSAAMAAEIHIRQDLEGEGWPSDKAIPEDSESYKKSGLW